MRGFDIERGGGPRREPRSGRKSVGMKGARTIQAGPSVPGLSESQRRLLETLKRNGSATTPVLAEATGLNVETVRHHLRRLEGLGLARRAGIRISGPGRPEVVHALTAEADAFFPQREGEVLRELAEHLKRTGNEALLESFFEAYIGDRRAEALARVAPLEGRARLEEVARILSELGFMAEAEGGDSPALRLCHCPLRELVGATTIPCRAELAFVRELLGAPSTRLSHIPAGDIACRYEVEGP